VEPGLLGDGGGLYFKHRSGERRAGSFGTPWAARLTKWDWGHCQIRR